MTDTITYYCEQFCAPNTTLIEAGGELPTTATIGECAECVTIRSWLCREVLPTIRRTGYYVPDGASLEDELRAMIEQHGWAPILDEVLAMAVRWLEDEA